MQITRDLNSNGKMIKQVYGDYMYGTICIPNKKESIVISINYISLFHITIYSINDVLILPEYIFPNTYRRNNNANISSCQGGIWLFLKLEPTAQSLGGWSYAPPPCAEAQRCHSVTSTRVSGAGGRAICIIPSVKY